MGMVVMAALFAGGAARGMRPGSSGSSCTALSDCENHHRGNGAGCAVAAIEMASSLAARAAQSPGCRYDDALIGNTPLFANVRSPASTLSNLWVGLVGDGYICLTGDEPPPLPS